MRDEGVIKFQCEWTAGPAPAEEAIGELNHWRRLLFHAGLIGVYPDGIGFGNLSRRLEQSRQFWITGTQTGHLAELNAGHYTQVTDYSIEGNRVFCRGPVKASSESLTHGMIYELNENIRAVVHVHHARLWQALKNKVPTTSESVPYGTQQMALAVQKLYEREGLAEARLFVMAGHEDGLISFDATLEKASQRLLAELKKLGS